MVLGYKKEDKPAAPPGSTAPQTLLPRALPSVVLVSRHAGEAENDDVGARKWSAHHLPGVIAEGADSRAAVDINGVVEQLREQLADGIAGFDVDSHLESQHRSKFARFWQEQALEARIARLRRDMVGVAEKAALDETQRLLADGNAAPEPALAGQDDDMEDMEEVGANYEQELEVRAWLRERGEEDAGAAGRVLQRLQEVEPTQWVATLNGLDEAEVMGIAQPGPLVTVTVVSGASLSIDGVNKDAVPLKAGKLRKLGGECSGTVHALSCRRLPPPKRTCAFSSLDCRVSPGKNKDTWQEQEFTLTNEELWWTSKQVRKSVKLADMGTVAEWSDIGIGHAFEIITRVKDGKVYKFSATDDADRDAWIDQLRTLIPPA